MTVSTISSLNTQLFTSGQQQISSGSNAIVGVNATSANDFLTPEQQNSLQDSADAKMAQQVENIKSNYQTAKDIDLMQAYYQQQQKLFDIYLQTNTDSNVNSSNISNNSAVSTLTDTYAALYQLHQDVKEGVGQFPEHERPETLPIEQLTKPLETTSQLSAQPGNQSALSHKQLEAYNSLMMPSTSSYVHLSA